MKSGYTVVYLEKAEKFFRKAPKNIARNIFSTLENVATDPFAPNNNLKKLKDPLSGYRLRVGDYRAIYILDTSKQRLLVVKINHRSEIYK